MGSPQLESEMTPEKRSQDPHMDGTALRFQDHGGEYPDTMPEAINRIDAEGRCCTYVPITRDGKLVDSQGFSLDAEGARLGKIHEIPHTRSRHRA
jgi:hypothetical protein